MEYPQTTEQDQSVSSGDFEVQQFLTFILANEEYGVNILRVQEIKGWDSVTPIPNTPSYMLGVINLRGTIVPIIDLRKRFGLAAVEYGTTTVVIVLKVKGQRGDRTMGFVVDAVSDVYNLTKAQMRSAPDFGTTVRSEFLQSLATVDEKMVILLDIDHLVDAEPLRADVSETVH